MSDPYIGEVRVISFNFAPKGWALCNGQLLPINQNQALFSVLGTTYGGDGLTTFALPDFRARMPIHQGQGFTIGARGGEAAHTLTINEIPAHNHLASGAPTATGSSPNGTVWAPADGAQEYYASPSTAMAASAIATSGGNQPHQNEAPYLVLNFIIALVGIFPSRN